MSTWHDGISLDDQLVAGWHRLKAERQRNGTLAIGLSILRRWPAAWLRVVATDTDAAYIAVHRRWDVSPAPQPTEQEIARAELAVKRAIAAIHEANTPVAEPLPRRDAA